MGSSPRVWGQDSFSSTYVFGARIIPTRVGTSTDSGNKVYTLWDHPHACGDKVIDIYRFTDKRGSSPRVWGQVLSFVNPAM